MNHERRYILDKEHIDIIDSGVLELVGHEWKNRDACISIPRKHPI
jgi:hypothetical protein